ncbi:MAG: redoxin domain-containing protein [Anaerolineae bacterium]|nr:redoxin domain-containing protein [Thermoflexales bacterium]MDW8408580.1 redoxin domain-containing protein [Anaerolineae bacterium]
MQACQLLLRREQVALLSVFCLIACSCAPIAGELSLSSTPLPYSRSAQPAADARHTTDPIRAGQIVARVNGEAITRRAWELAVRLDVMMSRLAGQPAPDPESTLDRLINAHLVLSHAQQAGWTATLQEAEQRLAELRKRWGVSEADLHVALEEGQLTLTDVLDEIRRLIVIDRYLSSLGDAQAASDWLRAQRAQAQVELYSGLVTRVAQVTGTPAPSLLLMRPSPSPHAVAVQPTPLPTALSPTPAADVGPFLGQAAPEFNLPQLNAEAKLSLAALKGRPVIINLWATWCPPCRQEIPALHAAARRYAEQGVVVLGVNVREPVETVRTFASAMAMEFPILLDTDGAVADRYKLQGIPTTLFLDAAGIVRARHLGLLNEDLIAEYLRPILAEAASNNPTPTASALAPDFELAGAYGRRVRLSDYRNRSQVVLVFYRATTCGSCLIQLAELQNAYEEFKQRGAEVLAIGVQDVETAARASVSAQAAYPILAETDHAVSARYGVYSVLGDGQVTPAVFVVDRAGMIVWSYIGRSAGDRPTTEDILAHLK